MTPAPVYCEPLQVVRKRPQVGEDTYLFGEPKAGVRQELPEGRRGQAVNESLELDGLQVIANGLGRMNDLVLERRIRIRNPP